MKTARVFLTLDLCIAVDAESLTDDVKRIEARDREVRAAALREAVETMAMANDGVQSPFAVLMRLALAAEASK